MCSGVGQDEGQLPAVMRGGRCSQVSILGAQSSRGNCQKCRRCPVVKGRELSEAEGFENGNVVEGDMVVWGKSELEGTMLNYDRLAQVDQPTRAPLSLISLWFLEQEMNPFYY